MTAAAVRGDIVPKPMLKANVDVFCATSFAARSPICSMTVRSTGSTG